MGMGERDLVMCNTWHLLVLNCMSHLSSNFWKISRAGRIKAILSVHYLLTFGKLLTLLIIQF